MKYIVAVVMGSFSGCLIYFIGSILLATALGFEGASQMPTLRAVLLFGGWALSASWLLNTPAISKILARGFLLGAAECLLVTGVLLIRPAVIGRGVLSAAIIGGVSLFMATVCLFGFAIVHFWQRVKSPSVTKPG